MRFRPWMQGLLLLGLSYQLPAADMTQYGPIKKGESLGKIIHQFYPRQKLSRAQVMLAVLQANPEAFSNHCNFNTLKIGVTLKIPEITTVQALNEEEASAEVTRQTDQWQARKKTPPSCAESKKASAETSTKTEATQATAPMLSDSPKSPLRDADSMLWTAIISGGLLSLFLLGWITRKSDATHPERAPDEIKPK